MKIVSDLTCLFCGEKVFETENSEEVITCFKNPTSAKLIDVIAYLECMTGHSCPYQIKYSIKE